MAVDLIDETEFTCPQCGSHKFGTVFEDGVHGVLDASAMVGYCYGDKTVRSPVGIRLVRCPFSWRRNDDAKYFRKTGRQHAATYVGTVA
jgi:hypothetical protein